jgi:N-acetylmuramoyl-L-alanine amidase
VLWLWPFALQAEGSVALVDAEKSAITDKGDAVQVDLTLSDGVPWRAFTLLAPYRLVLDFSDVQFERDISNESKVISRVLQGPIGPGWARMVLALNAPMAISTAGLDTETEEGRAILSVVLDPVSPEDFAAKAGAPPSAVFTLPRRSSVTPKPRRMDDGTLHVMLDPGHGGIDPGAETDGIVEADLMLTFARELKDVLVQSGRFRVSLTRDEDVFVPLETRITLARTAGADVFLSLHADAVGEDSEAVSGATVYTLSDKASDRASQSLAERHAQSDLLAGVDLQDDGDEIAMVLMDMARRETEPRTDALADMLVAELSEFASGANSRPRRFAGFTVLKAPDIPSALVELGFLSSAKDRERLISKDWRLKTAAAIRDALLIWAEDDQARSDLLRK